MGLVKALLCLLVLQLSIFSAAAEPNYTKIFFASITEWGPTAHRFLTEHSTNIQWWR